MSATAETPSLSAGMFPQFQDTPGPFGLQGGQIRAYGTILKNAGWYNELGGKLGFGDIAPYDLAHISHELDEGQAVIIMSRHDSYEAFVARPGFGRIMRDSDEIETREITFGETPLSDMIGVKDGDLEMYPGLEYVAMRGVIAIAQQRIFFNGEMGARLRQLFTHGIGTIGDQVLANANTAETVLSRQGLAAFQDARPLLLPPYDVEAYARSIDLQDLSRGDFMCKVLEFGGIAEPYFNVLGKYFLAADKK